MAQEPLVWNGAVTKVYTVTGISTVSNGTKAERVTRRHETCTRQKKH